MPKPEVPPGQVPPTPAELVLSVVAQATGLSAADPETARLTEVALAEGRRHCGWHVCPVWTDHVVALDGRGGLSMRLPTLNLVELKETWEDDIELDVAELEVSATGRVVKPILWPDSLWPDEPYTRCWTQRLGGITVVMDHGYESAPAWSQALLSYIARTASSMKSGGRHRDAVGPFRYGAVALAEGSPFTRAERAVLDLYRLEQTT